jgi:prepilin peptidase CpaA
MPLILVQAWPAYCLVAALLILAAAHDLAARTIPNGASLALAGAGLVLRLAGGDLAEGMLAAGGVFAAAALCWQAGWLGGGDVKLLAALALALPPAGTLPMLAWTSLWGGGIALLYLLLLRVVPPPAPIRPAGLLRRLLRAERWRIRRRGPIPYGCAIALGGLTVLAAG